METLTHTGLLKLIASAKGMMIVGLQALTDSKARKTGNPYGMIYKQVRAVGFVGADYEMGVNRELFKRGKRTTFESESLPWGKWLIPGKVIVNDGEFYLRTQSTPGNRRKQAARVICYRDASGKFLGYGDVAKFLPAPSESRKQSQAGLTSFSKRVDDTAHQIWVRNYAFNSIQKIRIAGITYKLVKDDAPKLGETYKAKEFHPTSPQWENQIESKLTERN